MIEKNNLNSFKKGVIYYFSGTGNTLYIADEFSKYFKEENIFLDLISIENIKTVKSQSKYDFLGIGFPTYACCPPKTVLSFLKSLPIVKNKSCFIFTTYSLYSGASLDIARIILEKKNYKIINYFKYKMPHNISFFFNRDLSSEKVLSNLLYKAKLNVKKDFNNLLKNKIKLRKSFFLKIIISKIVSYLFNIMYIKKVEWIVDYSKCNLCGLCQKICPVENIIVKHKKRKVIFGEECLFCSRCYNFCPENAINYKKINKTKNYKRYDIFKNRIIK